MKFIKLTPSDDLLAIVRKCNENFRQLAWSSQQATKAQSQIDAASVAQALQEINGELDNIRNQEIPNAVASAYPPVGSYILNQFDPSNDYPGTIWQQVDTITTDGNVTIPLWRRYVI